MPVEELEKIMVDSARKAGILYTNADCLRSMSDEELAEWLDINNFVMLKGPKCKGCFSGECDSKDCRQCYLDWLKSPAKRADNG